MCRFCGCVVVDAGVLKKPLRSVASTLRRARAHTHTHILLQANEAICNQCSELHVSSERVGRAIAFPNFWGKSGSDPCTARSRKCRRGQPNNLGVLTLVGPTALKTPTFETVVR